MDITALARDLTLFLTPLLPYLLKKVSENAIQEVGKKVGADTWDQAKALWKKLRPKVEASPVAQDMVRKAIEQPQDPRVKIALELQMEDILQEDIALAVEVAYLWESVKGSASTAIASGRGSIAIGGNVTNSNVITGDQNAAK